jgi:membrane associated rhomboid family serine protease
MYSTNRFGRCFCKRVIKYSSSLDWQSYTAHGLAGRRFAMSVLPIARLAVASPRVGALPARFAAARLAPAVARPRQRASSLKCVNVAPAPGASPRPAQPSHPKQRRGRFTVPSAGKGGFNALPDGTDDLIKKYGDTARATGQFIGKASGLANEKKGFKLKRGGGGSRGYNEGNGVFLLLLLNVVLFVLDNWMHLPFMKLLYLNHMHPQWWQFVTSIFCHANWGHLSGNIFFLYVFGNIVEQEEGTFGVWFSYLFTGIGAGLASYLMLPKGVGGVLGMGAAATVSLGASGAVFGLFAISVLTKLRLDFKKLLECVILGQFVIERFVSEAKMATIAGGVGAGGVNHVAHLAGALVGVFLIVGLSKILPPEK